MLRKRTIAVLTGATVAIALVPWRAEADFNINDDLIVDGSACIGFDCVNGEVFGFDTIRIKENNLRIRAEDTSSTASFPQRDWQIVFNESTNGGLEKFSIEDLSAGRIPFTIEGAAPANSVYVDDGGRLALGTNNPVVELHIVDGDTPTLRLEQDGSSGFTPQTWDVAGNETNFFVRDATNGSKLPFRIRPNADSNSIFIDNNSEIGMGTSSPEGSLHIADNRTDFAPHLLLENTNSSNSFVGLRLETNDTTPTVLDFNNTGDEFRLNFNDGDTQEFALTKDGDLLLGPGGNQGTISVDADTLCFNNVLVAGNAPCP